MKAKTRAPGAPKRRVVILGGGMAGLTTALELTDPANPRSEEYEVTVYQMGWRLGGKGASGRNPDPAFHHRIEEHGLHVWFGCYDNAFRLIRRCYDQLGRAPDAPLATWRDAFKPHGTAGIEELVGKSWHHWLGTFPPNAAVPGEGGLLPLWEYVRIAIEAFYGQFLAAPHAPSPTGDEQLPIPGRRERALDRFASALEAKIGRFIVRVIRRVHFLAMLINAGELAIIRVFRLILLWHWRRLKHRIQSEEGERRRWIVMHALYAGLRGMVDQRVLERGFKVINGQDLREFLAKYAIDDGGIMIDSYFLIASYDGMFAYVNGDNRMPPGVRFPPFAKLEAGEALRAGIRFYLTYKGASVWKMQAGMGDTVFTPMYETLRRRGVRIEFFHRVDALRGAADGRSVESIEVTRQARLRPDLERHGYEPLIDVKGLGCWPSEPLWDQLVDGHLLRAAGADFEAWGAQEEQAGTFTLTRGRDFDDVVLAISVGALPYIACDLIRVNPKWQEMIRHMRTTRTMGSQLWLRRTAWQLGWTDMQQPVVSGLETGPLDTWADMSHLIEREAWAAGGVPGHEQYPLNLAYFCGPMLDETPLVVGECGPVEPQPVDQRRENEKVRAEMDTMLREHIAPVFPASLRPDGEFEWDLLVDQRSAPGTGDDRLAAQYYRANVSPSERYVLSVPGSDRYRLPAHDPAGFANLYLAGDWTDCGFNLGCIEAAAMSGMLAATALSGYPGRRTIIGLDW